jgi:hypothetical protein
MPRYEFFRNNANNLFKKFSLGFNNTYNSNNNMQYKNACMFSLSICTVIIEKTSEKIGVLI